MSRSLVTALAGVALAATLGGCITLPDEGAVTSVPEAANNGVNDDFQFNPRPPQLGEGPVETVDHFFEAMTAKPVSTVVARQFLSEAGAATWSPEDGILTYDTATSPEGSSRVQVKLFGVNRLDARGRWLSGAQKDEVTLTFPMAPERGQWRITEAPDNLIVDVSWFETTYRPANLYFFDPGARVLVPEPVFVPRGDQLATALVRGLLAGPMGANLERTFLPGGATLDLAVTVTRDGVAQVPLRGDLDTLPADSIERMAAQLAWTLRQDSRIREVQLLGNGEPLALPGGATRIAVDFGADYDPTGIFAAGELYGLRQGVVVRVVSGIAQPISGPFGTRPFGLRDVSVSLDNSLVAGVKDDGRSAVLSAVFGSQLGPYSEARTVISDAVDLLHPAWDISGRLWLVDRRPGGAVVSVFRNGTLQRVDVPGVSGERVIDFLVSRDGTRLVAAIDRPTSDRIVSSRILGGATPTATRATPFVRGGGNVLQVSAIGWHSPTSIFFVNALGGQQSELRSTSLDGSPATFNPDAVYSLQDDLDTHIISSPRPDEPTYLVTADGEVTSIGSSVDAPPLGIAALHYVG